MAFINVSTSVPKFASEVVTGDVVVEMGLLFVEGKVREVEEASAETLQSGSDLIDGLWL
jgi:hypothetical protein